MKERTQQGLAVTTAFLSLFSIVGDLRSHGLSPSDRLIVRGQRDVLDGSLVRVTEISEAVDDSPSIWIPLSKETIC